MSYRLYKSLLWVAFIVRTAFRERKKKTIANTDLSFSARKSFRGNMEESATLVHVVSLNTGHRAPIIAFKFVKSVVVVSTSSTVVLVAEHW